MATEGRRAPGDEFHYESRCGLSWKKPAPGSRLRATRRSNGTECRSLPQGHEGVCKVDGGGPDLRDTSPGSRKKREKVVHEAPGSSFPVLLLRNHALLITAQALQALSPDSIDRLTPRIMILTAANASMWHWFQCFDQTHQSLKIPRAQQPGSIRGTGCRDPMGEEIEDANASVAVVHGPFLQEGVGMLTNEKAGGALQRPRASRPQRTSEGPLLAAPVAGRGRARSALDSHLPQSDKFFSIAGLVISPCLPQVCLRSARTFPSRAPHRNPNSLHSLGSRPRVAAGAPPLELWRSSQSFQGFGSTRVGLVSSFLTGSDRVRTLHHPSA